MVCKTLFVALAAVGLSAAVVPKYDSSLNMTIDPNRASLQQRASWCQGQTNTCEILCDRDTDTNTCIRETLKYDCTCSKNKSAPGLQYYQQTMPTYICQELFNECNAENVGNADDQKACKTNIQDLCGTVPPAKANDGGSGGDSATGTGTATGTAGPSNTAEATGNDKGGSTSTSKAFAAPTLAPVGQAAVAAIGLLAVLA